MFQVVFFFLFSYSMNSVGVPSRSKFLVQEATVLDRNGRQTFPHQLQIPKGTHINLLTMLSSAYDENNGHVRHHRRKKKTTTATTAPTTVTTTTTTTTTTSKTPIIFFPNSESEAECLSTGSRLQNERGQFAVFYSIKQLFRFALNQHIQPCGPSPLDLQHCHAPGEQRQREQQQ